MGFSTMDSWMVPNRFLGQNTALTDPKESVTYLEIMVQLRK